MSFFEQENFSLLKIESGCCISRNVILLVHDFSPSYLDTTLKPIYGKIILKRNSFIGAGTIMLPGSVIEENSIVGEGSLVKGVIEDNVVVEKIQQE